MLGFGYGVWRVVSGSAGPPCSIGYEAGSVWAGFGMIPYITVHADRDLIMNATFRMFTFRLPQLLDAVGPCRDARGSVSNQQVNTRGCLSSHDVYNFRSNLNICEDV